VILVDQVTIRQTVNVLMVVATIVVNGLANALPLNGVTTGAISDSFDVYFVPAGYVFSIWGLIYLGLAAFAVYQALPRQRNNPRLHRIGYLFALSSVANMAWIFLWHYQQFVPTLVAMVVLLLSLIAIYLRLRSGGERERVSVGERWAVWVPFSVYLGWITVATVANVTVVLESLNWDGWGIAPEVWAVIMLVVATIIAMTMAATRRDVAYLAVIVWAFVGIAVEQAGAPMVVTTAWAMAAVVGLAAVATLLFGSRRQGLSDASQSRS
jgi:translocator protein